MATTSHTGDPVLEPSLRPLADIVLAVVDPDPEVRTTIALQLGGPGVVTYPDSEVESLAGYRPGPQPLVVIFGPGLADAAGLAKIESFTRSRPDAGAVLVTVEQSTELLQQAFRSGIRDVLELPVETAALYQSLERVARTLTGLPTSPPPIEMPSMDGRVIAVTSTKGGSGKSVVATNLATVLAQQGPGPVVLVDGDLQFGDVAVMMRLGASHTLAEAVTAGDRLDSQYLQSLLVRHEPSGLLVLMAPLEPSFSELVSAKDIVRIIDVLRTFCSHVVVDTQSGMNDVTLSVIEHSDETLMVASTDVPNIKDTKIGLQTLHRLGVDASKLTLVLNRANSKVHLNISEVEHTLGMKADCQIPSSLVVPLSVNRGVPVVLDAPKSEVAGSFEQLAKRFAVGERAVPVKRSRSLFGR
ncbi:MAG TPA: P-loop NTPase [Acidimicrobiia bacterium]|nr:P-loop NTPase [Acidimicrobiia bacterium]